jgi:hypothetical protein
MMSAVLSFALMQWGLSSASAAYQQVDHFAGTAGEMQPRNAFPGESAQQYNERWPEEVQLGGVGGMAVNYTGAGGVPAGTIYAAAKEGGETPLIARYNPDRSFSGRWQVLAKAKEEERIGKGLSPYEHCGPEGEPAYPNCLPHPGSGGGGWVDVDVDESTGNIYVFSFESLTAGDTMITVYSPDASEVIARFGIKAPSGEKVSESPAKFHEAAGSGGGAVNSNGEVYVFDWENRTPFYHRVMQFKPKTPGDYSEYEYAGQSQDIATGVFPKPLPAKPVTDAAGNLYVASEENVEMYDPANPSAPPICSFFFKKSGIRSMTVNPLTGEVFFSSYLSHKLHRLNPCSAGKFSEAEAIEIAPPRFALFGMAVDPVAPFEAGGLAGILYGGSPDAEGGETKGSEKESALGYVFAQPNEKPPAIISESVSGVTQSSARLEGAVNPEGTPSRYVFQYIGDAAYQANEPAERFAGAGETPLGGARIEGSKTIPVAATVGGLTPGAEYHFRIVASSNCKPSEPEKECLAEGAGETFRTYPVEAAGLPDGRAYELVSPVQKHGGQVVPVNSDVSSCSSECKPGFIDDRFPMQSAPDGNSIVYQGTPFSFDNSALIENQYIARRDGSGWHTVDLSPVQIQSRNNSGYKAFAADLSTGVLAQTNEALTPEGPAGYSNIYAQPTSEPALLMRLLSEPPPNRSSGSLGTNTFRLAFAGGSADFSRLFFSANDALTPEAEGGPEAKTNLYERSGGELHLVNFAPGDATTLPDAVFGSGTLLRRGNPNGPDSFIVHAISDDGSRVFFTTEEDGHLYVREDGTTTRQIVDPGSCATSLKPEERVCFLTAAADGSKALLSNGHLHDVEDEEPMTDLTQGKGGFLGVVGQSEDLSRVYFVDTAVLTDEEENSHGDKAQAGKNNLYAWHEGATAFIATLHIGDKDGWELAPIHRAAAASPDGRWLAFRSQAPLTGFDNTGLCTSDNAGGFITGPCNEVFLYQAETGELRCPSCNRTGAPPRGPSRLTRIQGGAPTLPAPRYLTDSGRLFFDTLDSLSPFDTNGKVEDVYEFEPNGVGSCMSEAGCVRLISAGRSGVDSNFLAADPSGRNVFFTSRDQLVGADVDELVDLYDAREGGGFPPTVGSSECQGEACLPSVSPPNDQTPSTLGIHGPGNVAKKGNGSPRCPRGRRAVRRKGKVRCIRGAKRRHNRHHRRDHGGRRHARGGGK